MNAVDILKYGHLTVLRTVEDLPPDAWETGGVCGVWTTKDIIAHLASFEHVLVEILTSFLDGGDTPYLKDYTAGPEFNDAEVKKRKHLTAVQVLAEYNDTQAETMMLAARIPPETWRQNGTLPWYGAEYSLDDFIVYTFYGHKREHTAQINVFKDRLKGG
jgi:hypothetical protein